MHKKLPRAPIPCRSPPGRAGHREDERHHDPAARTDQPYRWHVNDGEEVVAVLDGQVEMRYREAGEGEHVAHPQGEACILVIEQEGSV